MACKKSKSEEPTQEANCRVPYVEYFQESPLLYVTAHPIDPAFYEMSSQACVKWVHKLQLVLEQVAHQFGLHKVHPVGHSYGYFFTSTPDPISAKQVQLQCDAGLALLKSISQFSFASETPLAVKVSLHVGDYAGAVTGKVCWSYDLYGAAVAFVVAMDKYATPGALQASQAAVKHLESKLFSEAGNLATSGQFYQILEYSPSSVVHSAESKPGPLTASIPVQATKLQGTRHASIEICQFEWFLVLSIFVLSVCSTVRSRHLNSLAWLKLSVFWVLPCMALGLLHRYPTTYKRVRTPLWMVHRVAKAMLFATYPCGLLSAKPCQSTLLAGLLLALEALGLKVSCVPYCVSAIVPVLVLLVYPIFTQAITRSSFLDTALYALLALSSSSVSWLVHNRACPN